MQRDDANAGVLKYLATGKAQDSKETKYPSTTAQTAGGVSCKKP